MASEAETFRTQSARLFDRAMRARDQGNHSAADMLLGTAQRCLENAAAIEAASAAIPKARLPTKLG